MDRLNFLRLLCIGAFIWLVFSVLTSCEPQKRGPKAPESKQMKLDSTSQYFDQQYRVYTLEGCEYIVSGVGSHKWGSHKGNCKNPIHYQVKQQSDTTLWLEKHFDCYVENCEFETDSKLYIVTTECGLQFYDKVRYSKGKVLSDFKSPKHK